MIWTDAACLVACALQEVLDEYWIAAERLVRRTVSSLVLACNTDTACFVTFSNEKRSCFCTKRF